MRRFFQLTLYILALACLAPAQQPILVDEFELNIGCEDLSARLDNFISELNKNPNGLGYVLIGGDLKSPDRALSRERYIDGYARYRDFDEARLNVLRGTTLNSRVALWLVPPGASFEVPNPPYELAANLRKTRLYSDMSERGACYTGPPLRMLSRYLNSNPNTVANIAIATPTTSAYNKEKATITKLFDETYRVSSARIRFFRAPGRTYTNVYELWLLKKP